MSTTTTSRRIVRRRKAGTDGLTAAERRAYANRFYASGEGAVPKLTAEQKAAREAALTRSMSSRRA